MEATAIDRSTDGAARAYQEIKERAALCDDEASVMILVAPDCDAICSCRILTSLLSTDNINYTVRSVRCLEELKEAEQEAAQQNYTSMILLNCAAQENLVLFFAELPATCRVYVFDHHRPFSHNLLKCKSEQFRCFDQGVKFDDDDIPSDGDSAEEFDDNDEEEEDQEEEEEEYESDGSVDDGPDRSDHAAAGKRGRPADAVDELEFAGARRGSKRRKRRLRRARDPRKAALRRKKRRWFKYYERHFYAAPTSLEMYKLSRLVGEPRNELLWLAIIGCTDCYLREQLSDSDYAAICEELKAMVGELNKSDVMVGDGTAEHQRGRDTGHEAANILPAGTDGHIAFIEDLRLPLFRHTSIFQGMMNSEYLVARLNGGDAADDQRKVEQLIATMSMSLKEAGQRYVHTKHETKANLNDRVLHMAAQQGLPRISFPSFQRQVAYGSMLAAADAVAAVNALLECSTSQPTQVGPDVYRDIATATAANGFWSQNRVAASGGSPGSGQEVSVEQIDHAGAWRKNFADAMDCLALRSDGSTLRRGLHIASIIQAAIVRLGRQAVRSGKVWKVGLVQVLRLDEMTELERRIFTQPLALARLGRFVLEKKRAEYAMMPKRRRPKGQIGPPLFICAHNSATGFYTVVGLPFMYEKHHFTIITFADALVEAGVESLATEVNEGFDVCQFYVSADTITRFLDKLTDMFQPEDFAAGAAGAALGGGEDDDSPGSGGGGGGGGGGGFADDFDQQPPPPRDDDDDDDDDDDVPGGLPPQLPPRPHQQHQAYDDDDDDDDDDEAPAMDPELDAFLDAQEEEDDAAEWAVADTLDYGEQLGSPARAAAGGPPAAQGASPPGPVEEPARSKPGEVEGAAEAVDAESAAGAVETA